MKSFILTSLVIFVVHLHSAECLITTSINSMESNLLSNAVRMYVHDCLQNDIFMCLKEKSLSFLENFTNDRKLAVGDSLTLIGTGVRSARDFQPLPADPEAREEQIGRRFYDAAANFLENSILQFRIPSAAIKEWKNVVEEGRKKKKKVKKVIPVFLLIKSLISAIVMPIVLSIIAFIAAGALFIAKISLIASGFSIYRTFKNAQNHSHEHIIGSAHPYGDFESSHPESPDWERNADKVKGSTAYSSYKTR